MKKLLFALIGLAVIIGLTQITSCKKNTVNPCEKFKPITADFIVGESFFGVDTVIDCDTLRRGKSLIFKALGDNGEEMNYDSYEWKIGNDSRLFDKKVFSLFFEDASQVQRLSVTLTVRDQSLANCFANGGQATLTKQYTLVPQNTSVVFGSYEGALIEAPNEKFVVSVRICQFGDVCTTNINKGCNNNADPPLSGARIRPEISYRSMYIDSFETFFTSCDNPKGWLYFGKSINDVIVEYTTGDPANRTAPRKQHRFIGKRIK